MLIPGLILPRIMCLPIPRWLLMQNLHQSMHQASVVLLLHAPPVMLCCHLDGAGRCLATGRCCGPLHALAPPVTPVTPHH
jgi:hypothetical protein